jgi:hypothetical protein
MVLSHSASVLQVVASSSGVLLFAAAAAAAARNHDHLESGRHVIMRRLWLHLLPVAQVMPFAMLFSPCSVFGDTSSTAVSNAPE